MKSTSDHLLKPDTISYRADRIDLPTFDGHDTLFKIKIFPHRSISPKTAQMIIAIVGVLCVFAGLRFIIAGAWPVVIFILFDIIALSFAFYFNFRSARLYEMIHLSKQSMIISRIYPNHQIEIWNLEPYWLRTHIEKSHENDKLQIISHGKQLEIGSFLSPYEKRGLKDTIDQALNKWKHQEFKA